MTWTNAFIRGECAVEVVLLNGGGGTIFLQTMAVGGSANFSYGGVSYNVAVDGDGVVSIDIGVEDAAPENLCVLVEPAYDTSELVYRVANMHSAYAAGWVRGTGSDIAVTADASGICTPDPVTSDFTGAVRVGMIGASGYGNPRPLLRFDAQFDEAPQPVSDCTELGRVTRCYVSGYQRVRVHESRLVRGESRCLVANFNGAVDAARTITSVTWQCQQPYIVAMSNARIPEGAREVAVDMAAQLPGCAWLKCIATLDNGEVYTQLFRVIVRGGPWFDGETTPSAGPTSLTSP